MDTRNKRALNKMELNSEIITAAAIMREQLRRNRLIVVLVPNQTDPHSPRKLRAVESQNPAWYRDFCDSYQARCSRPRNRTKSDTCIKRRNTIRALMEIETGRADSEYAIRLLPYIQNEIEKMESDPYYDLRYA